MVVEHIILASRRILAVFPLGLPVAFAVYGLDSGGLKIKVASSIVAISSIHLLQVLLNASQYTEPRIMWRVIMHITFVASELMPGVLDKIMAKH